MNLNTYTNAHLASNRMSITKRSPTPIHIRILVGANTEANIDSNAYAHAHANTDTHTQAHAQTHVINKTHDNTDGISDINADGKTLLRLPLIIINLQ